MPTQSKSPYLTIPTLATLVTLTLPQTLREQPVPQGLVRNMQIFSGKLLSRQGGPKTHVTLAIAGQYPQSQIITFGPVGWMPTQAMNDAGIGEFWWYARKSLFG